MGLLEKLLESIVQGGPWAALAGALVFWLGGKFDKLTEAIRLREDQDAKAHATLDGKLERLLDRRLP